MLVDVQEGSLFNEEVIRAADVYRVICVTISGQHPGIAEADRQMTRLDSPGLLPFGLPIFVNNLCPLLGSVLFVDSINSTNFIPIVFILWILIELLFYVYIRFIVSPELDNQPTHAKAEFKHPKDIMSAVYRYYEILGDVYPFREFVSKFCLMANFNDIYSQNYESVLAFSIYLKPLEALTSEEYAVVGELRRKAAEIFHIEWKKGYNPEVKQIQFTSDPVTYIHRPYALYWLLKLGECYTNTKDLRFNEFTFHKLSKGKG